MSNTTGINNLESKLIGNQIDGYVIEEGPLGHPGAIGSVYKVHPVNRDNVKRAMKIYKEEFSGNDDFMKCFHREMDSWQTIQDKAKERKINLDNIVLIYGSGTVTNTGTKSDGCAYIVMEYMDGNTLDDHFGDTEVDMKEKLRLIAEVAKGLNAAHDAEVFHLDVHARNALLHNNRKILKIGDFGVSSIIEKTRLGTAEAYVKISGRAIRYPAHEQDEGRANKSTDMFQIGAMMLELFAGIRQPTTGYEPKLKERSDMPDELKQLIIECVQWDYTKRPSDAEFIKRILGLRDSIIKRETRYDQLLDAATTHLVKISKRAESKSCGTLEPKDIDDLYKGLSDFYSLLKTENFETPLVKLETIINDTLERDLGRMMKFASQYEADDIKVVSSTVANHAGIYKQAAEKWSSYTGKKLKRVLPTYEFKII